MKKITRTKRRSKYEGEWNKVLHSIRIIAGDPKNHIKKAARGINNARR